MIKIDRGGPPAGFDIRRLEWSNGFTIARAGNLKQTASKFWSTVRPEIQPDAEELAKRHHFKCAFCESKMSHVAFPHVEHYRPKSKPPFEGLMFDWNNWLLSCGVCNTKKGRSFGDEAYRLLDPANEDPTLHISFVGHLPVKLSARGHETIEKLQLRRSALSGERELWLSTIGVLLLSIVYGHTETRSAARQYLIWCMQDDAPYASMTRCFLRKKAPHFADPIVPHPKVAAKDTLNKILELVEKKMPELGKLL